VLSDDDIRAMLERHWALTGEIDKIDADHDATYHPDAILEFPQSGERFRGRETFKAWRSKYPARVRIAIRRLRGSGDFWVSENQITYDDDKSVQTVNILELRDGKVVREAIYFAEPFPAPDWRAPYVDEESGPA